MDGIVKSPARALERKGIVLKRYLQIHFSSVISVLLSSIGMKGRLCLTNK